MQKNLADHKTSKDTQNNADTTPTIKHDGLSYEISKALYTNLKGRKVNIQQHFL